MIIVFITCLTEGPYSCPGITFLFVRGRDVAVSMQEEKVYPGTKSGHSGPVNIYPYSAEVVVT